MIRIFAHSDDLTSERIFAHSNARAMKIEGDSKLKMSPIEAKSIENWLRYYPKQLEMARIT